MGGILRFVVLCFMLLASHNNVEDRSMQMSYRLPHICSRDQTGVWSLTLLIVCMWNVPSCRETPPLFSCPSFLSRYRHSNPFWLKLKCCVVNTAALICHNTWMRAIPWVWKGGWKTSLPLLTVCRSFEGSYSWKIFLALWMIYFGVPL